MMEINGNKFIDKYKGYQKKTGQQSALLIGHGKIGGIKAVAVGYNFAFGGAAFSQRENEHFLTAAQFAMQNNVELFFWTNEHILHKSKPHNIHSQYNPFNIHMFWTKNKCFEKNTLNISE